MLFIIIMVIGNYVIVDCLVGIDMVDTDDGKVNNDDDYDNDYADAYAVAYADAYAVAYDDAALHDDNCDAYADAALHDDNCDDYDDCGIIIHFIIETFK